MRNLKPLLIIVLVMLVLTAVGMIVSYVNNVDASSDGSEEPPIIDDPAPVVEGLFHCSVEMMWDLHRPDAFFGIVEVFPAFGEWPVIKTESHTAESLGYTLIRIAGISVPSQFADRTRPLKFAERERTRFDNAMRYVWALISQSETLILRNPVAVESEGYVACDVFVVIGGHELNLGELMIADGHAKPSGDWDWGARDVVEK